MINFGKIPQAIFASGFALTVAATQAQIPLAPAIIGAVAGDRAIYVSFSPAASVSGTTYFATCDLPNAIYPDPLPPPTSIFSAQTSPIAVRTRPYETALLNNGTEYECFVTANNALGSSPRSLAQRATPSATAPLTLLSVHSRKTHGAADVFDVPIDSTVPIAGPVTVESRAIGAGGHRIVFAFNAAVSSTGGLIAAVAIDEAGALVSVSTSVPAQPGNEVVLTIAALSDNKRITVTLPQVNSTAMNALASVGFVVGDVNDSRSVNITDLSSVKAQSGKRANAANFRADINTSGFITAADISSVKSRRGDLPPPTGLEPGTIMFATQVPMPVDFAGRLSTFGNHRPGEDIAPRGGDLMIRYPDGVLRFLTKEAGYGMEGFQGVNAIAVRDPAVHWTGDKAVFSMIVGSAPVQHANNGYVWQLYEVTGLKRGDTAVVTKVANQPATYNNISPIYGTDDRIIFTSDRPHNGLAHLYPQRDEYESTATNTGLLSLDPANGDLKLLNHAPSGAFSPSIDSFGRLVFIRWDHLLRDQQAAVPANGAVNFASEGLGAAKIGAVETFPEDREFTPQTPYGPVNRNAPNFFTPWQMSEDGTDEETLNHVGRHELSWQNMKKTFANDTALSDETGPQFRANQIPLSIDNGGLFHLREDPLNPGTFFSIAAPEFGTLTADRIVKLTGAPNISAESMTLTNMTVTQTQVSNGTYPDGRFRTPLPTTLGTLIASHTPATTATPADMGVFRLRQLALNASTGRYTAGTALTSGITKSVSWWDTANLQTFNGALWELEPVEVRVRQRPVRPAAPLESPEASVFAEEGVSESTFRTWMRNNNLALIVTRDQTKRDRADLQQPFNLRVPGGVTTIKTGSTGRVYDIAHFQIFQGDLVRGYDNRGPGRRVIAQPMHDDAGKNIPNPSGPPSSVKIAADGSTAAFVPARRALSWQTTDLAGEPIVRERFWVTTQPGEIRVCASCHGANTLTQAGTPGPTNKPEALRTLLRAWKLLPP
jgi:hypothetical protein